MARSISPAASAKRSRMPASTSLRSRKGANSWFRMDDTTASRTRPLRSRRTRCKVPPFATCSRSVRKENAHTNAGGLPPIIRASSLSNAAWRANKIPFAARCKAGSKITTRMLRERLAESKILLLGPGREFYSDGFERTGTGSINVLLEPALFLQLSDKGHGLVGRTRAELRDDVDQRALDILGHALGIAADVDVGALCQPRPQLAADLAHAILHVELLVAVARPRQRQPRQQPRRLHRVELVGIEEVAAAALMAEEQPVLSGRAGRAAVVQEGAERGDASARPDHDDRRVRIRWQRETMRLLNVNFYVIAGLDTLGQENRGQSQPPALPNQIAHAIDCQRQLAGRCVVRRRYRIEPWLQRLQRFDKRFRVWPHAGEFLQRRHHVERRGVAIRVFALRQSTRLLALGAAGDKRQQLEQRVRRRRQRYVRYQDVAQGLAVDLGRMRGAQQCDDLID